MQQRTCTIDGCDKPYRARGLCASHWNAAYRKDQHREVPCAVCGTMVVKNAPGIKRRSVCSDRCRAELRRDASPPKPSVPFDRVAHARAQRSAIRAALEDGDDAALLKAILTDCVETPDGCWQWLRVMKDGYPIVLIAGRQHFVHRLALEAATQRQLGSQPAHHICANTACVNPAHLQPVTHRENADEMMARRYMERRIVELEDALQALAPDHPILKHVSIPRGSDRAQP